MSDTLVSTSGEVAAEGTAKRRQVMDGARAVFTKLGFDGASMNDIAKAAGVSKGTLYAYFESKERLFEAMIREDRAQQAERLLDFSHDGDDVETLLTRFGNRFVTMVQRPEMLAQARMVLAACAKFPELGRAFFEAGPNYGARRFAQELEKFTARGALKIDDRLVAARHFLDMLHGGDVKAVMFRARGELSPGETEKVVADVLRVFMAAYGPR